MFCLGFPDKESRHVFIGEISRGTQVMCNVHDLQHRMMTMRPSSVDAYRVIQ